MVELKSEAKEVEKDFTAQNLKKVMKFKHGQIT